MERLEALLEWGGVKKDVVCLVLGGISLLVSIFELAPGLPFDAAWVAIILCGVPIVLEAVIGLVTAFDIKADVLVSMALIASVIIGEDFAAGEVAFIMQLGALLEDLTVAKARAGIEKLVQLTPQTARRINVSGEETIPAESVQVGDLLRVLPGETIPVDGVIVSGVTSVNQAVMTGESLPVDKAPGDEVSSGTVNQFGSFDMRASKVGEDSSIQRMIRLVQSADAGKAKIVGLADRWATWVVVTALLAAGITWAVTGEIIRAVTILVVFCPCALVLATPTAIMAAIGNATKHGFLVREGDALERLAKVRRVCFDKTGTLTTGRPEVAAVRCFDPALDEAELYRLAAGVEARSEHPLGKAVVSCWREGAGAQAPEAEDFAMLPGRGVGAVVEGRRVLAGNPELLAAEGASPARENTRSSGRRGIPRAGLLGHLHSRLRRGGRLHRPLGHPAPRRGRRNNRRARGGRGAGAAHRRPPQRRRDNCRRGGHQRMQIRVPARGQAQVDRRVPGSGPARLHDRRRHKRRARPQASLHRHRNGRRGQRYRHRRRGYCPCER